MLEFSSPAFNLLICATHRTGSNLLEQYLKASQVAGRPREYYSPRLAKELADQTGLPNPEEDFLAYHQAITKKWRTPNGLFAAKIMWRHLDFAHNQVAACPEGKSILKSSPWETLMALHPNPMVIHVSRRNKVAQAISMVRAKQTGVFSTIHLDKGRVAEIAPVEYDFHLIRFHVEKLTKEDAAWEELFKLHGVSAKKVMFEDFVKDPRGQTVELLKALELPEPEIWHWPEVTIRSQSDPINAEWHARYLADTKRADKLIDTYRERRHRARKALERQAAREVRWERWQKSKLGRGILAVERWFLRDTKPLNPMDARGDGVMTSQRN